MYLVKEILLNLNIYKDENENYNKLYISNDRLLD